MIFTEKEIRDALKEEPEQAKVMIEANALELQNKTLVAERRHNLRSFLTPVYVVIVSGVISVGASIYVSSMEATARMNLEDRKSTAQRDLEGLKAKNLIDLERERAEAEFAQQAFVQNDLNQTANALRFWVEAGVLRKEKYGNIDLLVERYAPSTSTQTQAAASSDSVLLMLGSDRTLEAAQYHKSQIIDDDNVIIIENRSRYRTALLFDTLAEANAHLQTLSEQVRAFEPYPIYQKDFCPNLPDAPNENGVYFC